MPAVCLQHCGRVWGRVPDIGGRRAWPGARAGARGLGDAGPRNPGLGVGAKAKGLGAGPGGESPCGRNAQPREGNKQRCTFACNNSFVRRYPFSLARGPKLAAPAPGSRPPTLSPPPPAPGPQPRPPAPPAGPKPPAFWRPRRGSPRGPHWAPMGERLLVGPFVFTAQTQRIKLFPP